MSPDAGGPLHGSGEAPRFHVVARYADLAEDVVISMAAVPEDLACPEIHIRTGEGAVGQVIENAQDRDDIGLLYPVMLREPRTLWNALAGYLNDLGLPRVTLVHAGEWDCFNFHLALAKQVRCEVTHIQHLERYDAALAERLNSARQSPEGRTNALHEARARCRALTGQPVGTHAVMMREMGIVEWSMSKCEA